MEDNFMILSISERRYRPCNANKDSSLNCIFFNEKCDSKCKLNPGPFLTVILNNPLKKDPQIIRSNLSDEKMFPCCLNLSYKELNILKKDEKLRNQIIKEIIEDSDENDEDKIRELLNSSL